MAFFASLLVYPTNQTLIESQKFHLWLPECTDALCLRYHPWLLLRIKVGKICQIVYFEVFLDYPTRLKSYIACLWPEASLIERIMPLDHLLENSEESGSASKISIKISLAVKINTFLVSQRILSLYFNLDCLTRSYLC